MIMYLAALRSVPEQLYEAAAVDGANWWQRRWYVTSASDRRVHEVFNWCPRVTEVRRLLANSQKLKKAIEGICELNHELLRPDAAASKSRRKQHD
jgi:hypothetical protein